MGGHGGLQEFYRRVAGRVMAILLILIVVSCMGGVPSESDAREAFASRVPRGDQSGPRPDRLILEGQCAANGDVRREALHRRLPGNHQLPLFT